MANKKRTHDTSIALHILALHILTTELIFVRSDQLLFNEKLLSISQRNQQNKATAVMVFIHDYTYGVIAAE